MLFARRAFGYFHHQSSRTYITCIFLIQPVCLSERRNWLIHNHYVRKEFELCKTIIRTVSEETKGMCEYANYIQGLILRHEGKIQESLEMFQICNILNPNSSDHIKQLARSL